MAEPQVYYAYSDNLNAPQVIANATGNVRWRWISEPFRTTAAESIPNSLENLVVNLRFPDQYFDKESGLSYNYFRDYDGTAGRYAQSDPIGLEGGMNTYTYVGGNPLSYSDLFGLQKLPTNSQHCIALREKMARKNEKLDGRWRDYDKPRPNQLPERVGPNELLSQSRRGHRTLINVDPGHSSEVLHLKLETALYRRV